MKRLGARKIRILAYRLALAVLAISLLLVPALADDDDADNIIEIVAVQSGSGDPSPENIRPISGVDCGQAGTVYGGSLNLTTGILTVTHAGLTLNGSETKWRVVNTHPGGLAWFVLYDVPAYSLRDGGRLMKAQIICSAYPYDPNIWIKTATGVLGQYSSNTYELNFTYTRFNTNASLDDWKSALAANPVQVVYPIAAPVTCQLTSAEVEGILDQLGYSLHPTPIPTSIGVYFGSEDLIGDLTAFTLAVWAMMLENSYLVLFLGFGLFCIGFDVFRRLRRGIRR